MKVMKMRMKREYHLWFTPAVADEIERRSKTELRSSSHIVERLIQQALAYEAAEQTEQTALPVLRDAIGEDHAAALERFRQAIRADTQEITRQNTDRLAALLVRSGRAASLTWRLLFRLIQKQWGNAIAQQWYEEARDQAGKAMATRLDSGKEVEQ
jgi:CRISPR/Cas system-associated endonuclease Cas1